MRARCPPSCYDSPGMYGGGSSYRRKFNPKDIPRTLELGPSYYGGGYMTPQEKFKYTRPRKPYRGGGYDCGPNDLPYELRGGGFSDFISKIGSGISKGIQFYKDNKDTFDSIIGAGKTMYNKYKGGGYPDEDYGYY